MLEMRPGRPEEVPAQKALWKAAFGDEDRYIDWFYECCGASADVLEVVEEGRLASMLALLPQTLTLPRRRNRLGLVYLRPGHRPRGAQQGLRPAASPLRGRLSGRAGSGLRYHCARRAKPVQILRDGGLCALLFHPEAGAAQEHAPARGGGRPAEPVEPGEYNTIRRRLLEGAPAVDYPEELIRYQQGMGRLSGGGLYRLSVDGAEGCAAAEYTDGESVLFKELLLSPDKMGRGLAALERVLPGARCYVRTPALWDGMKGSYLQPFGMIKWYSAEKRALWGEGTHGYMGLGFD